MPLSVVLPAPLPSIWHPEASSLLQTAINLSSNFSLTFSLGNNWIQQYVFWVNMSIFQGISVIAFSIIQVQGLWSSWIFVSLSPVIVLIIIVRTGLGWRARFCVWWVALASEGLWAWCALPISHQPAQLPTNTLCSPLDLRAHPRTRLGPEGKLLLWLRSNYKPRGWGMSESAFSKVKLSGCEVVPSLGDVIGAHLVMQIYLLLI